MKSANVAFTLGAAGLAGTVFALGFIATLAQAQGNTIERGEQVYDYWCAPCHDPGPGHPGTQSLAFRYDGTEVPAVLEDRTDLTPEFVRTLVRQGMLSMAPFRKTEITDAELDALAAYLSGQ